MKVMMMMIIIIIIIIIITDLNIPKNKPDIIVHHKIIKEVHF